MTGPDGAGNNERTRDDDQAVHEAQWRFSQEMDEAAAAKDEDALVRAFQKYLADTRDLKGRYDSYEQVVGIALRSLETITGRKQTPASAWTHLQRKWAATQSFGGTSTPPRRPPPLERPAERPRPSAWTAPAPVPAPVPPRDRAPQVPPQTPSARLPLDDEPDGPAWEQPVAAGASRPRGNLVVGAAALAAVAVVVYLVTGSGGDDKKGIGGFGAAGGQAAQLQSQPLGQAPAQAQGAQAAAAAGDQLVVVNMQFTQSLVRAEGKCPANGPAAGADFSPKTPSKVTINKTKRTVRIENTDGVASNEVPYDVTTGLATITYTNATDARASTVKITEQSIDGESSFFAFRGRQGGEQYLDCKFVLKTTAKAVS